MTFVKGQSGNPGGRKRSPLSDALRKDLTPAKAASVAATLLAEAEAGNMQAMSILFDRVEGKPLQPHELGGPGGGPFRIVIETVNDRDGSTPAG